MEQTKKPDGISRVTGQMKLSTDRTSRIGNVVAELNDVDYLLMANEAGERTLIKDFSFSFPNNGRIGVVGPNG